MLLNPLSRYLCPSQRRRRHARELASLARLIRPAELWMKLHTREDGRIGVVQLHRTRAGSHTGACRRRASRPSSSLGRLFFLLLPSLFISPFLFFPLILLTGGPRNPSAISRAYLVKVSVRRATNFGEKAHTIYAATRLNINSSFPSINSTCAFAATCLRRCLAGWWFHMPLKARKVCLMEANIINDCEVRDYRNRYCQYNWRDTLRYFFLSSQKAIC